MKTPAKATIGLSAALMLLTACIPSVNPFYLAQDVQFDSRLLGEWRLKPKKDSEIQTWKFEAAADKAYTLVVTDPGEKRGSFSANLFNLKGKLFLDIVPQRWEFDPQQADLVGIAMTPGHLLLRVVQIEPTLKLAFFDFDWLAKFLEKNPKAVAHRAEEDRPLFTASTPDLQTFVLQHLADGELFAEPEEYIREQPAAAAVPNPAKPSAEPSGTPEALRSNR